MGGGDSRGGAWGGGPWGDRSPGDYFTGDDIRQFRGEARRWMGEAQALRNMLREQNVDPKELDEIMRRMRELDSDRVYKDVDELERLQSFVAEGIKRFEYDLRRAAGAEADRARRRRLGRSAAGVQVAGRGVLPVAVEVPSAEMRKLLSASVVAVLLAASFAEAQRGMGRGGFGRWGGEAGVPPRFATEAEQDGGFHFCRLMYTAGARRSSAAWAGAPTIPTPTSTSRFACRS